MNSNSFIAWNEDGAIVLVMFEGEVFNPYGLIFEFVYLKIPV